MTSGWMLSFPGVLNLSICLALSVTTSRLLVFGGAVTLWVDPRDFWMPLYMPPMLPLAATVLMLWLSSCQYSLAHLLSSLDLASNHLSPKSSKSWLLKCLTQVFPWLRSGVACVVRGQSIFNRLFEFLKLLWMLQFGCVNVWLPFLFGAMKFLWHHLGLRHSNEWSESQEALGMSGWEARAWGLYIWQWSCQAQMPVPGTMVVPWHPVLWLCLEIGVGHAEAIRAKLQQGLYILIDLTNSKGTWAGRPKRRGLHLAGKLPRRTSCSLLWMFLMASFRYRTRLLP